MLLQLRKNSIIAHHRLNVIPVQEEGDYRSPEIKCYTGSGRRRL